MNSREKILSKLRGGPRPFANQQPPASYRPMVPITEQAPAALQARFVGEATKAGCSVHQLDEAGAIEVILQVIGTDTAVSSWDPDHIPLPQLTEALEKANIQRRGQDAAVRVGLTGVAAALAATGSVVVMSGHGRYRAASLLPPVHIAIMTTEQIVPDLESWWAAQKATRLEQMRRHSNVVVITGPSRTADIAMQLVMGMHGPREMHLILLQTTGN